MQDGKLQCPGCGRSSVVEDHETGEMICSKCGCVAEERLADAGAEWRSFRDEGDDKSRTGSGSTLAMHDMGLSTVIGAANRDSTGRPIAADVRGTMERLRTWDSRTHARTSAQRNLRHALTEMDKLKDKLALTEASLEMAAYTYRKAMEKNLVRGRSIHGIVAACVYAACRDSNTPRTLDDVADGINIRRKDVARCYRTLFREMDMSMPVADPALGVSRIASLAGLGEKTRRLANSILTKAKKAGLVAGKDPRGMAAAALYLACISTGEPKSQKEISSASGVTEVTIRNRCSGLRNMLEESQ
ncbi:MAG: transcription initiation factor IIB [Nitrosopumilus sp.]|nr:transcription initiation factor IIB [Nitrosopumilus sp.]CAI9831499.1 Transcription initiation factor IIB [Nitrosopumilaceae archaeon]MDA7940783.1 transcription initiation factor IIB [Nitrosopumilus sp.]MDA7942991.1 transcription initiation factor IIB [Nitrosopumilus sp.]MDA7944598.1 transcription initiation factor IIB [Nitrosopumilus sp.]